MKTATRRRLLFLLPFPPRHDATHGGGRAAAGLLTELAARHDIALLCLRGDTEPPVDTRLRRCCEIVEEIRRPWAVTGAPHWWLRNARLMASLVVSRPMWVADWMSTTFSARVRTVTAAWRPDIVQIEYHVMAQHIPSMASCAAPRILTEYEPGISAAPYLKQSLPILGRLIHAADRLAWQRYERDAMQSVQAVVVFTERDRAALAPLASGTRIACIPLGTVVPDRPFDPRGGWPPRILFVGNFLHPPNADAAHRLVHAIFPAVQARYPEAELLIVGDQPPRELAQVKGAGIIVTGRVPDVRPYLDQAALVVAPLRHGGGMRVKVLEALAVGKAVIASHLGAEGLNLADGDQIALEDSDRGFIERIVALLVDPEQREGLGQRAYAWARAHLGWQEPIAAYEALYDTLLESRASVEAACLTPR